jgi:hypothetical protein
MRDRGVIVFTVAFLLSLIPGSSQAHDVTAATSLTRFKVPSGSTLAGDKVVVFGRVKSADQVCNAGIEVGLYRAQAGGDRLLATDVTDVEGEYFFDRRPRRDQTLFIRFDGLVQSVTGHSHTCGGSESREVKIRVTR